MIKPFLMQKIRFLIHENPTFSTKKKQLVTVSKCYFDIMEIFNHLLNDILKRKIV